MVAVASDSPPNVIAVGRVVIASRPRCTTCPQQCLLWQCKDGTDMAPDLSSSSRADSVIPFRLV